MFYKKITPHFLLLLSLLGCESNASPTSITYTKIGACVEQVENDNAAFSRLQCPSVAGFALNITQQSPQYFTVLLNNNGAVAASELATYSHELPMEPGQAIEWHVVDGVPRFMVFRLHVQSAEAENKPQEILTLNLVQKDRICPLASIDVKKTPKANEAIRALIASKYKDVKDCPQVVSVF